MIFFTPNLLCGLNSLPGPGIIDDRKLCVPSMKEKFLVVIPKDLYFFKVKFCVRPFPQELISTNHVTNVLKTLKKEVLPGRISLAFPDCKETVLSIGGIVPNSA